MKESIERDDIIEQKNQYKTNWSFSDGRETDFLYFFLDKLKKNKKFTQTTSS